MKIKYILVALFATALICLTGCSTFAKATKEYSSAITPIHSAVLVQSMVLLQHHKSVVDAFVARKKLEDQDATVLIVKEEDKIIILELYHKDEQ